MPGPGAGNETRELPVVCGDESMAGIKQRQGAAGAVVERVNEVFKARRIVNGFPEGVGKLKIEAGQGPFVKTYLKRVEARVCDCIFPEDTSEYRDAIRRAAVPTERITQRGRVPA